MVSISAGVAGSSRRFLIVAPAPRMCTGEDEISEDVREFIARTGGNMTIAAPAQLFDLARNLQVNENSTVREVLNLSSGEGQVLFNAEHSDAAGAPLKVPGLEGFSGGQACGPDGC